MDPACARAGARSAGSRRPRTASRFVGVELDLDGRLIRLDLLDLLDVPRLTQVGLRERELRQAFARVADDHSPYTRPERQLRERLRPAHGREDIGGDPVDLGIAALGKVVGQGPRAPVHGALAPPGPDLR